MIFRDLKIKEELIKALDELNYITPTQIQEKALPFILEGKDLLGIAQTGTGKTATFSLPILNSFLEQNKKSMEKHPRALILAPTRELCAQIGQNLAAYSKYTDTTSLVTYGGVSAGPQIEALKKRQDILIATPGRLVDLVEQKDVFLEDIEVLVLDEADKIIKMGFRADLKKILKKLPKPRQNLFFSATMNKEIKQTALEILEDPVNVEIEEEKVNLNLIEQNVLYVLKENKLKTLLELLKRKEVKRAIIFANSKLNADNIVRYLSNNNIKSEALHSGKSNTHREKVIRHVQLNEIKFMVATDLVSRGLDFTNMTHVINFDIPNDFENYVHRIGRIGRAGKKGVAFSLCSLDERNNFKKIEGENKSHINTVNHEYHSNLVKTGEKSSNSKFRPRPKTKKKSTYNNRIKKR